MQLDFTAFNTQLNADTMTIYDGDSTAANPFGTFSGGGAANNPGFVSATPTNPTGCLTIEFISNGSGTTTGWAATMSCLTPCQTINSQLDSASPAPNGDGYIRVCPNDPITLSGSGIFSVDGTGATYEWDLGDGNTVAGQTATFSYPNPGVYIVNLNIRDTNTSIDPLGCTNTNLINQVIQVGTEPDFTGTQAAQSTICYGDTTTITGVVNPVEFINDCTPPVSGTTFLPDGSGAVYQTCITVDCFESNQTLTDPNQLLNICLNMEHSYLGDLQITIISPNGQQAILKAYPGGGGTYLGGANDDGSNTPGVGADYCFSMTGTTLLVNGPTMIAGSNPPSASIVPGTYLPQQSFANLVGSPLNGDWCIRVVDNLAIDNGFIFSWGMAFDPNIQPPELSFTPVITSEGWDADASIINTTGNTITVQPATAGQHCYTYRVTDDFGCEYTEQVCIDVLPEIINDQPNNLFLCNPGAPPYIFDLTQNTPVMLAPTPVPADLVVTYHETQADADADTNPIATPGAYVGTDGQIIYVRIEYQTSGCYETETFTLNITSQPTINPVGDMVVCDDPSNDGFAQFNLESQTPGILGAQIPTDFIVTYYASFTDADTSTGALVSPYTNTGNPQPIYVRIERVGDPLCNNVSLTPAFNLIINPSDDASFTMTPTCDGATATVTGTPGGTFTFNPVPTDAAVIDSVTGTVTGGTSGASYTVEYTTTGICPLSSTQTFNVLITDDASFTMTPTCDGATATITGTPGGTFAFNPVPTDAAVIDSITGTVTGGTSGVSYTVEYTTSGVCPSVSTQTFTVIPVDDASFTMTPTCDGATATITGTPGGTFAFNPVPTDAAVINAATGTITGGTSAATYSVEYTTSGTCPASSIQNVTVLTSDDPSFTMTPTCDGATATVSGTPGGTFTFNPVPTDAAVIDSVTGTVTGGTSGTSYTVEYTTSGVCPLSSTQTFNVLVTDDSSFTMTPTCDGATATINGVTGGAFAFNPIPTDTAVIDVLTGTVTNATPGVSYTVEYTTNGVCPSTSLVTFTVHPLPVIVVPTLLGVCDDNVPDGFTSIDLSVKNNEITGNNPNYVVSYYLTQLDADSDMNMLTMPYTNISNPQTVYVRVEDINTGCYDTTTLDLQVDQAPVAFVPTPLEYCDPDSDGFGEFTLTDAEAEITGGAPGLTVTYHETMADAENNVNAQASPYNNIVVYTQTLYARVESSVLTTNCATIVPLVLIVNDTPQIEDPSPLEECDDNTDGFVQFDLTSKNAEILDGLDPAQYAVSYYETQADANTPVNMIATPNAYTNTVAFNQTLWVRVDDTANGCYKLTTLELIVNALPVLVQPSPLVLCDVNNPGDEVEAFNLEDANTQILNGQTGITLTYYETQADADADTNPITSPYSNTVNPQTIYVRAVTNTTGCVSTITLDLRVNPLPSVVTPTPIEECDPDNDGFASFDLESRTLQIINGDLNIVVTYHETMADADSDQNALTSPYDNIVANTQTVYARKENTLTGCYRVIPLVLNVLPSPVVPVDIDDYVVCDTNADGFAQFNLTTKNAEILGGQAPAQFVLTYHVSQANANTGANPIVNTTNYTNVTNPQIIYVRLVSVANGCIKTGQFEIRVELPPTAVQPTPLQLCDDEIADEMTVFDLTVKDNEITGGNGSWSVSYYTTNADAQANTNVIAPATAYTNMSVNGNPANPQTLYVRVTDTDTGCTDFTTLTIRVLPNPTPSTDPSDIELCDDINTGDAEEVFDLTINETYIINGEVGVTATYHETMNDAEAGTNAIPDPTMYTNTSTPQTIYVRVTNNITGCYTIVDFDIIVNPLPAVVAVTDFIACEVNSDGFYAFDLTSKDAEVLNGQDPVMFNVTYHATQAGADNLTGALVSPYINLTNPQQIFVAITNTITGCSISTVSFNIEVQEGALANSDMQPITYVICDNIGDNDGFGQFDLTTQDAEVLDGQDPVNYIVSYYSTLVDAELGVNPIPTVYENTSNPQVIYARVDNDTPDGLGMDSSICYAVTELTLQVDLLPIFDLDDSYILCVDTNGSEVVNPPLLDTGLSPADYTFVWRLDGMVLPGETGPSLTATQSGTYSVEVTNNTTGCMNTDSAEVLESSPPTVVATVTTQAFSETHVIEAVATGDGEYEYSLDGGPWQSSGTFEDVSSGEHTITARDINGCGEASTTVIVMDYPHFFTPNGDGYHDTWNIIGIADQPNAKIYIFDRYGKLLKQISPSGQGWNGTYNGEPLPTSDYWFTVEYDEPNTGERKQFKAHFTLKR